MKRNRKLAGLIIALVLTSSVVAFAQVSRPYRNGSVWDVGFIRMKPGMESAYLNYIATDWKREQEELKKEGLILSYKVLTTESHGTDDWNIMLLTEYKDMATMEANEAKQDALYQRVTGNDEAQREGYRKRLEIREVMSNRTAREITLEPRR
jgi:hypothetical protein